MFLDFFVLRMIGQMIVLIHVALRGAADEASLALKDIGEREYYLIKGKR